MSNQWCWTLDPDKYICQRFHEWINSPIQAWALLEDQIKCHPSVTWKGLGSSKQSLRMVINKWYTKDVLLSSPDYRAQIGWWSLFLLWTLLWGTLLPVKKSTWKSTHQDSIFTLVSCLFDDAFSLFIGKVWCFYWLWCCIGFHRHKCHVLYQNKLIDRIP